MLTYFKECVTTKYADFNGRARRAEFWGFAAVYLALFFPLYLVGSIFSATESAAGLGVVFLVLAWLLSLALLVPGIAVSVRRLHDRDMSGWFYLLGFVPLGGLVLFVFFCLEGTLGANRFGPDPRMTAPGYGMPAQDQFQQPFGQPSFGQPSFGQAPSQQPFAQDPGPALHQGPQQKQF